MKNSKPTPAGPPELRRGALPPTTAGPPAPEMLAQALGHRFRRRELLDEALRHSSFINEQPDSSLKDNERLEFLGDAVLDLAVSHLLMAHFRDCSEGELSKYRAMIVDESGLCQIARQLDLGAYLALGRGEELTGGREKPSILANTLEAVIGAVYEDAGFARTLPIIRRLFGPFIREAGAKGATGDYKSQLQEYTQQVFKTLPSYHQVDESGPPHDRVFTVRVELRGRTLAQGVGKSKKEAEQLAAKAALRLREET